MEILSVRLKPITKKWLEDKAKKEGVKLTSMARYIIETEEIKDKLKKGENNEND